MLYTLFLWQTKPVFTDLQAAGSKHLVALAEGFDVAGEAGRKGGDGGDESPAKKRLRSGKETKNEMETEEEATIGVLCVFMRIGLFCLFKAMCMTWSALFCAVWLTMCVACCDVVVKSFFSHGCECSDSFVLFC